MGNIIESRLVSRSLHVAPHLMLLTVKQLTRENAELSEEVQQLRAAVNVYRELARTKGPARERGSSWGRVKTGGRKRNGACQNCVVVLP
jgi:hypothetical protein